MSVALASATRVGVPSPIALRVERSISHRASCVTRCRSAVTKPNAFPRIDTVSGNASWCTSRASLRTPRGLVIVSAEGDDDSMRPSTRNELNVSALVSELADVSKLGKRDEAYFLGQTGLLFCIAFPPFGGDLTKADLGLQPSLMDPVIGTSLLVLAAVLIKAGVTDLGNSLTPFPKPRDDNELITEGAYETTRHPMYSGLIFGACGAALITGSPVRTLLAAALAGLLYFKAQKEETYLVEKHGEKYAEYAAKVPQLVPNVVGIGKLLEGVFDQSTPEQ